MTCRAAFGRNRAWRRRRLSGWSICAIGGGKARYSDQDTSFLPTILNLTNQLTNQYPPQPHLQLPNIGAFTSRPDFSTLPEENKMAAKQFAEKLISEHLVAVFSKSYCPCEWRRGGRESVDIMACTAC